MGWILSSTLSRCFAVYSRVALGALQEKLLKPEARQKGKEQVKEKARDSVLQLLSRLQAEQTQRKPGALHLAEKSKNLFQ